MVLGSMNSCCAAHSSAMAAATAWYGTTTGFCAGVRGVLPSSVTAKPPTAEPTPTSL